MTRNTVHNVLIGLLLLISQGGFSATKKDALRRGVDQVADRWDKILKAYVDPESGRVDYLALEAGGRDELSTLMKEFSAVDVSKETDASKRAFYINFYNAGMMANILRFAREQKLDLKSKKFLELKINDIDVPGGNIWNGSYRFKYLANDITLDDIEHGLIRGQQKDKFGNLSVSVLDPRIHVAVNCAAASCPRVREVAYRERNIELLLDENMRSVVNNPAQFKKLSEKKAAVNSIFYWYYEDFDTHGKKVLKNKGAGSYLATFIKRDSVGGSWLAEHLEENFNDRSKFSLKLSSAFAFEYDWQINDKRNSK